MLSWRLINTVYMLHSQSRESLYLIYLLMQKKANLFVNRVICSLIVFITTEISTNGIAEDCCKINKISFLHIMLVFFF